MKKMQKQNSEKLWKLLSTVRFAIEKTKYASHRTDLPSYCLFNLPKQKTENARTFGITKEAHRVTDCCEWLIQSVVLLNDHYTRNIKITGQG